MSTALAHSLPQTCVGFGRLNGKAKRIAPGGKDLPLGRSSFSPSGTVLLSGSSSISVTLTVKPDGNAPVRDYPVILTADLGSIHKEIRATVQVVNDKRVGFDMSASPSVLTVVRNGNGRFTLKLTPRGGFEGTVNLGGIGLPLGTSSFSPSGPILLSGSNAISVTLTVNPDGNAPVGNYPVILTSDSGSIRNEISVTVAVR